MNRIDLRHDSCYGLCRATFACGDEDEQFHDTVINIAAPTLDNKDVLIPNRCLNANRGFAIAEFLQVNFRFRGSQTFTDSFDQERVRGPGENFDASHRKLGGRSIALKAEEW